MQVELSDRELALVLAALRNWQMDALNEDLVDTFRDHFFEQEPLSDDEVDELCQRLNSGGELQVLTKAAP
jgi:hypothetical protein